jgi:hypothetical protein
MANVRPIAVMAGLVLGCALTLAAPAAEPPSHASGGAGLASFPIVPRGRIDPDLRQVEPFTVLDDLLRRERLQTPTYRSLSVRDCQCLAAWASQSADTFDRKAVACSASCQSRQRSNARSEKLAALEAAILRDAALEERNRAAGEMLVLYFRLAEAEAKSDILRDSQATIAQGLQQCRLLQAKGFPLGDEYESLRQQQVSALGREVDVVTAIERLNLQLQQNLKLGPENERCRIWPSADWTVVAEPGTVADAIAQGWAHRAELILIRRVLCMVDPDTAPVIRVVLGQVNPLLGMTCEARLSGWRLLFQALCGGPTANPQEIAALREQLRALLRDREKAAALEIQQAVWDVQVGLRRIAVTREEVRGWQRQLDELAARAERGIETFPARTTAQLKLLEARAQLVERVMAWNIGRVKRDQSVGILAESCGFVPCPLPCH